LLKWLGAFDDYIDTGRVSIETIKCSMPIRSSSLLSHTKTILYSISLNSVIEGKILTAKTKPFSHPVHIEKSMATIPSYAYMQINNRPGVECDQVNPVGV
jgi:endoglucanase Acf2